MKRSSPATLAAATAAVVLLALPFVGLLLDIPWTRLGELLTSDTLLTAVRVTAIVVPISTLVVVVLGTPLAWLLARYNDRWLVPVRALVVVPIVLPPVIAGLVLLSAFGRRGLLGGALENLGIILPFSLAGAVLTAAFVSLPFFVLAVENGFREIPDAVLDAGRTLGVAEHRELTQIAIPHATRAMRVGVVLAAARALGEFGATITFAGNVEGATRTLPLATFSALESDPELARVIGLLLVMIAVGVIFSLRRSLIPQGR